MNVSEPPLSPTPRAGPGRGRARAVSPVLMLNTWREIVLVAAGLVLPALVLMLLAGWGAAAPAITLAWCAGGVLLVRHGLASGAHPHARFGAANRVTLVRLALAGLLAGLLGTNAWAPPLAAPGTSALAWGVVVLATVTALLDAIDGWLARRSGLTSAFGARFDMETDAAFIVVLCALVWQAGQAGPWVMAAGLMRYLFVTAAGVWPWLAAPLAPSRRRQTVCVVQITSLIICLGPVVPPGAATALAAASLALLSLSFAIDIRTLAQARRPPTET